MARKRSKVFLVLCFLMIVTPVFSIDIANANRLRRDADSQSQEGTTSSSSGSSGSSSSGSGSSSSGSGSSSSGSGNNSSSSGGSNPGQGPPFTMTEFGEKLQKLLERDRPTRKGGADDAFELDTDLNDFSDLLTQLSLLAMRSPADLKGFDAQDVFGRVSKPEARKKAQANKCLKNPVALRAFLEEFLKGLKELMRIRVHANTLQSFTELDDKDLDDLAKKGAQGRPLPRGQSDVTASGGDGGGDDGGHDGGQSQAGSASSTAGGPTAAGSQESASVNASKTENKLEGIDMEDVFEKLSESSVECMSGFLDADDSRALCRQFSQQSARVFASFLATAADCPRYLDDGDDLDPAHQRALLNQFLKKPIKDWSKEEVRHAIKLAPDVIDDDFLESVPQQILDENLELFGSIASRWRGNAKFQLEYRKRITQEKLADFNASAIASLGKGLLALTIEELDDFNPQALLEARIDKFFKSDDAKLDKDDDEDEYEDDEREVKRLALGLRMKEAGSKGPQNLARVVRFLYDDLQFLGKVDADQLFESMAELPDLDLDVDDASSLFQRVSQSKTFPQPAQFTRQTVQKVRSALPGMGITQLRQLPKKVVLESLEDLKDVFFGESEARELLENVVEKASDLTAARVREMGRLARGLGAEDLEAMPDHVLSEVLDDMDPLHLSHVQRRIITAKTLQAERKQGTLRLLQLPRFAGAVSVTDIGDLSDDEVVGTLNVTSKMSWRLSQAVTIVGKVQNTLGGRGLRPADLPAMGSLVQGLLPGQLQAMLDRDNQVDDLANVLGNQQSYLTSAQIDDLMEVITERDFNTDSAEFPITADFVAQKGTFLPYLRPEVWKKVKLEGKGLESFLSVLATMNTRKLPRGHLKMVAQRILPLIPVEADMSPSEGDDLKIQQLGEFMLGVSPAQLRQLNPKALLNNMPVLGTLPFTRPQAAAILERVQVADPKWKCKSTSIVNVGPLLQFASQEDLDQLCDSELASSVSILEKRMSRRTERLQERREAGLWREDSQHPPGSLQAVQDPKGPENPDDATEDLEGRSRLTQRLLAAALAPAATAGGKTRVRRATDEKPLTCSVLRALKGDVVNVPVSKIQSMEKTEFQDCLEFLGSENGWKKEQLNTLHLHLSQVYGPISNWTNEMIRQAGVLLSPLQAAQFSQLMITGVDALNSVGKHGRLDTEQLKAGFSRWLELKNASIEKITYGEFSSLSNFMCGLTPKQILFMPLDVFRRSLDLIGRAKACDDKQRLAYYVRLSKAYGAVNYHWEPAVVRDAGFILGSMPPFGVHLMTKDHVAVIRPSTIPTLPALFFRAMADKQLAYLSSNQVNALTEDQLRGLEPSQRQILARKASLPIIEETPTEKPTPKNAATSFRWSVTSLLAAILIAIVVC